MSEQRRLSACRSVSSLLLFVLCLTSCGRFRGPEWVVQKAFKAFQENDSNGVNQLMSQQGLANAALYCGGAAINCLRQNYAGGGEAKEIAAKLISESGGSAKVELRTTWSAMNGERCQTYSLDKTDDGWRITFFDAPTLCAGQR